MYVYINYILYIYGFKELTMKQFQQKLVIYFKERIKKSRAKRDFI